VHTRRGGEGGLSPTVGWQRRLQLYHSGGEGRRDGCGELWESMAAARAMER
jgi:hypothetical protein